jgi:ferric-dicitrate binding protein FerR (iron transport regulator)
MSERSATLDSTRQASRESAAYWLAALEDPACTAEERREFISWLRSATANVEEFLRMGTCCIVCAIPGCGRRGTSRH